MRNVPRTASVSQYDHGVRDTGRGRYGRRALVRLRPARRAHTTAVSRTATQGVVRGDAAAHSVRATPPFRLLVGVAEPRARHNGKRLPHRVSTIFLTRRAASRRARGTGTHFPLDARTSSHGRSVERDCRAPFRPYRTAQ